MTHCVWGREETKEGSTLHRDTFIHLGGMWSGLCPWLEGGTVSCPRVETDPRSFSRNHMARGPNTDYHIWACQDSAGHG